MQHSSPLHWRCCWLPREAPFATEAMEALTRRGVCASDVLGLVQASGRAKHHMPWLEKLIEGYAAAAAHRHQGAVAQLEGGQHCRACMLSSQYVPLRYRCRERVC